jgi:hypothetical protein
MRMTRYDADFKAYILTFTADSAGYKNVTSSAVLYSSFRGDLQPINKNKYNLAEFGIDEGANSFIFFYDIDHPLVVGYIIQDLTTLKKYEVRNVQSWAWHYEAILSSYEGPI